MSPVQKAVGSIWDAQASHEQHYAWNNSESHGQPPAGHLSGCIHILGPYKQLLPSAKVVNALMHTLAALHLMGYDQASNWRCMLSADRFCRFQRAWMIPRSRRFKASSGSRPVIVVHLCMAGVHHLVPFECCTMHAQDDKLSGRAHDVIIGQDHAAGSIG